MNRPRAGQEDLSHREEFSSDAMQPECRCRSDDFNSFADSLCDESSRSIHRRL